MSQLNQPNTKKKQPATNDHSAAWPANGLIDLTKHDPPHASATLEQWHLHCHLATVKGRHFSLFASFLRTAIGKDSTTGEVNYAQSVTWALTDTDTQKYYAASSEQVTTHQPVNTATWKFITNNNSFEKIQEGKYRLTLNDASNGVTGELIFMPFVNPVRHGTNGVLAGAHGEELFNYFIPACEVNGIITVPGEASLDVEGSGWYDHSFGNPTINTAATGTTGRRLSLQLDNSWQIALYELFNNNQAVGRWATLIDPDGQAIHINDFQLIAGETYTSTHNATTYPVKWLLHIAEQYINIDLQATLPNQEFIAGDATQARWEGQVQARGSFGKRMVNGLGYVITQNA